MKPKIKLACLIIVSNLVIALASGLGVKVFNDPLFHDSLAVYIGICYPLSFFGIWRLIKWKDEGGRGETNN